MTDINTAKQQISTAKSQILEQRKKAELSKQQLEQAKSKLPNLTSQQALRKSYSGLQGRQKRLQIEKAREEIKSRIGDVREYEKELSSYESGVLKAEKDVKEYEKKVKEAQLRQEQLQTAYEVYTNQKLGIALEGIPEDIKQEARELADKAEESYATQIQVSKEQMKKEFPEYNITFNPFRRNLGGTFKGLEKEMPKINVSSFDRETKLDLKEFQELADVSTKSSRNLFGGELFPLVGASERETKREITMTGNVIGLQKEVPMSSTMVSEDKSFFSKAINIITSPLESAREFSEKQSALVSAESLIGMGNVQTVSGDRVDIGGNIKEFTEKTIIPERKVKIPEPYFGTIQPGKTRYTDVTIPSTEIKEIISLPSRGANFFSKEVGSFASSVVGAYYGVQGKGKEDIIKVKQAYNTTIIKPQFGTRQYDLFTGKEIVDYQEVTSPAVTVTVRETQEQARKVGEVGSKIGIYATPIIGGIVFASEVESELRPYDYNVFGFAKENPEQTAIIVGGLTLFGGLKAGKVIKSSSINKAIKESISKLDDVKLKSVTVIDQGEGRVLVKGFREAEGITQEVNYYGRIVETESGKKFIPTGRGNVITSGIAEPNYLGFGGDKKVFSFGQEFEAGAKGTMIKTDSLGEIKVFEELGTSGLKEGRTYFGETKLLSDIKDTTKQLSSEIKIIDKGGTYSKEITAPLQEGNIFGFKPERNPVFGFNEKLFLRLNKREEGLIINIPKKSSGESFGFKGGGRKSSKQYLEQLYGKDLTTIQTADITDKLTSTLKEIKPKKSGRSMLPLVSGKQESIIKTETRPQESQFAGTGLYERTEEFGSMPEQQKTATINILADRTEPRSLNILSDVKQRLDTRRKEKTKEKINLGLNTRTKTKPREDIISRNKLRSLLELKQPTRQTTEGLSPQNTGIKTPKKTPPTKTGLLPLPPTGKRKEPSKKEIGLFKAIGKRFGKEVNLGFGTKKQTEKKLEKFLKGTLGASGFVTDPTGKKVETSLLSKAGFRKSKKSPLIVVEEKEKRLKKGSGETKEIQIFRKKSSKKKLFGL